MTLKAICFGEIFDFDRIGDEHRARLAEQFVHRILAGARNRLIGRDHHALDFGKIVQRLERDDELSRRAVRIGDDAFLDAAQRVGVHFRHDQRHVAVHAPGVELSMTIAPWRRDLGRPFLGDCAARAHQHDVGALEVVMLERLDLEDVVAERDLRADGARGGQRDDFAVRETARSARTLSISRPTFPVAPTTATLYCICWIPCGRRRGPQAGAHIRQTAKGEKWATRSVSDKSRRRRSDLSEPWHWTVHFQGGNGTIGRCPRPRPTLSR